MEKYLVTIEFRYNAAPKYNDDYTSRSKEVTIGVYDDFDDACKEGNKLMEALENQFDLHVFPSGITAVKERFSKNGGCLGGKKTLISNSAYLKTPFSFYARITTLRYENVNDVVKDVLESVKSYRDWKSDDND